MSTNLTREAPAIIVRATKEVILSETADQREKSRNNATSNYSSIGAYYALFASRVERPGLKKKQSMRSRKLRIT